MLPFASPSLPFRRCSNPVIQKQPFSPSSSSSTLSPSDLAAPLWLLNEFCLCLNELTGKQWAISHRFFHLPVLTETWRTQPWCFRTKQVGCSLHPRSWILVQLLKFCCQFTEIIFKKKKRKTGNPALRRRRVPYTASLPQMQQLHLHVLHVLPALVSLT